MHFYSSVLTCVSPELTLTEVVLGPAGGPWSMSGFCDSFREKFCNVKDLEGRNSSLHHHQAIPTSSILRSTGRQTGDKHHSAGCANLAEGSLRRWWKVSAWCHPPPLSAQILLSRAVTYKASQTQFLNSDSLCPSETSPLMFELFDVTRNIQTKIFFFLCWPATIQQSF